MKIAGVIFLALLLAGGGLAQTVETLGTPNAPDLSGQYDLGPSNSDNVTNSHDPIFAIAGLQGGGTFVQLLRDGVVVREMENFSSQQFLQDLSPLEGFHYYTARQRNGTKVGSESAGLGVIFDFTPPAVQIYPLQSDPATVLPVRAELLFSEPVYDVVNDDFSYTGSTTNINTLNIDLTGTGIIRQLAFRSISLPGTIVIDLPNSRARDLAGNGHVGPPGPDCIINFQPPQTTINYRARIQSISGQLIKGPLTAQLTDTLTNQVYKTRVNHAGYFTFKGIQQSVGTTRQFRIHVDNKTFRILNQTTSLGDTDVLGATVSLP